MNTKAVMPITDETELGGWVMNKPDWKDAPGWAEWLAQDKSGKWYWFEQKPRIIESDKQWYSTHYQPASACNSDSYSWKETLEQRQ